MNIRFLARIRSETGSVSTLCFSFPASTDLRLLPQLIADRATEFEGLLNSPWCYHPDDIELILLESVSFSGFSWPVSDL